MPSNSAISHIIFDFGNVLFELDFDLFYHNLQKLFPVSPLSEKMKTALLDYERGRISTEVFLSEIQHHTSTYVLPNKIIEIWNSLLIDLPFKRLEMLEILAKDYKVCLLSNINELHINYARSYIAENYDIFNFECRFFHQHYYSNEIGFRKPEPELYQFVLNSLNVNPENILFIDDLQENIDAAKTLNWNAIRHDPQHDITEYIDHYLTLPEN